MSDFYQTGVVATLHRLGKPSLDKIEEELTWYSVERPIALLLPSLYSELEGDALQRIVACLREVKYLKEVVVTLGPASEEEFTRARRFFSVLPPTDEPHLEYRTAPLGHLRGHTAGRTLHR